ncbi:MAG: ATP-dependent zinc metalloprotease FtsH [Candidatus Omnitrophica bacterium]|nr:ATP-dependent zinc metalloprotease FtsH [Candidatus Omnitrophota bacterium]
MADNDLKKNLPPVNPNSNKKNGRKKLNNNSGNWLFWVLLGFIFLVLINQNGGGISKLSMPEELTYSKFFSYVKENKQTNKITKLSLSEGAERKLTGKFNDGKEFSLYIPQDDKDLINAIRENVPNFEVVPPQTFWNQMFFSFVPLLLIIGFFWFLSRRGSQMGNKIWNFGKSRAKEGKAGSITFADVAGVDEAKEELQEVIEFLKDPKRFQTLGGKIPKGVLLVGPPGTGKTLLAKAVAGEAGVPFFSLSGSDFVEMFVGVGASRVRDLFEQARRAAKVSGKGAIIFIDEIDAVGRLRFAGIGGGNDEREQTLNALLVEMDGFNGQEGAIVIAATNRPDTLDPALLRPGRFDRQIVVGLPDINGREGILKVHSKTIKLAEDVDLRKIAQQTVYFSGADLANVCNEAALLAARRNKPAVTMEEFYAAVERVTMGPEKKNRSISKKEKSITAYHEAGHALLSYLVDDVDTFTKVSIIPRGMAGGFTLTPPTEDKHYLNRNELYGQMVVLLGGLVAEKLCTGTTSTGVSNDLEKVTAVSRNMICSYGMSDKLGTLAYGKRGQHHFLGRDLMEERDYSDATARVIDEEVQALVQRAYDQAQGMLSEHMEVLKRMADYLIEKENMDIEVAKTTLGLGDIKVKKHEKPEASEAL